MSSNLLSDSFDEFDDDLLSEVLSNFNSQPTLSQQDSKPASTKEKSDTLDEDFSFDESDFISLSEIADQLASKSLKSNGDIEKREYVLSNSTPQTNNSNFKDKATKNDPIKEFKESLYLENKNNLKRKVKDLGQDFIVPSNNNKLNPSNAFYNPNLFAELFLKPHTIKRRVVSSLPSSSLSRNEKRNSMKGVQSLTFDLTNRLWADTFSPTQLNDAVVHSGKIKEIRTWLQNVLTKKSKSKILVISGPSGTGKSTILNLVAQELGAVTVEWFSPQVLSSNSFKDSFSNGKAILNNFIKSHLDHFSILEHFYGFLRSSLHFRSLISTSEHPKQIVVLDELPNIDLISTRQAIQNILENYCHDSRPFNPLVILVSDVHNFIDTESDRHQTGYLASARDIIPLDLINQGFVTKINFNPVANTFIRKALIRCLQFRYDSIIDKKSRLNNILTELAENAQGDLRAAVNALQLRCYGCPSLTYIERDQNPKSDISLNLFHLIGKIFYCKWSNQTCKMDLNLEVFLENCPIDLPRLSDFLFQNYLSFLPSPDSFSNAADGFSLSQSLQPPWSKDPHPQASQLLLSMLSIRTLLASLKENLDTVSFKKIYSPIFWKAKRDQTKNQSLISQASWLSMILSKTAFEAKKMSDLPILRSTTSTLMVTEFLPYLSKMKRLNSELESVTTFKIQNNCFSGVEFKENDDIQMITLEDYDF